MPDKEELKINEEDLQEITRLIGEGYTSGIADSKTDDNKSVRISWNLEMNKFIND